MSGADPYGQDEDDVPETERRMENPRVEGAPRRLRSETDMRVGPGRRPLSHNPMRPGPPLTSLPYDPRDPGSIGAPVTRLDYNPLQHSGSTAIQDAPPWVMENRAAYDANSMEWLPTWIAAQAQRGVYPPGWARQLCIRRGRPDLAQWCDVVSASMRKQGA